MKQENRELYKEAWSKWGSYFQLDMMKEESIELALAVSHYARGRASMEDVVEEMADVILMIEQIQVVLSIPDEAIESVKLEKLEKLRGLLLLANAERE